MVFFRVDLVGIGGSQRLLFEGVNYFKNKGYNVFILTSKFDKIALFSDDYKFDVISVEDKYFVSKIPILRGLWSIYKLRKKLKQINPDIIISMQDQIGCVYSWLITILSPYIYIAYINE
ncbi:MAG: glycosyltransferase, partial [Atribacterota bacterium]|nr:glycosyltransferase [Atribacterota bacterium]